VRPCGSICAQLLCLGGFGILAVCAPGASGAERAGTTQQQLHRLERQNEALQAQVEKQQRLLDELARKLSDLEKDRASPVAEKDEEPSTGRQRAGGFDFGKINFSMEGGLALFHSESHGVYPNAEFRVDEAKLFIEAPVWKDVYFFTELNITTREDPNIYLQAGELYLDFENLSRLWNRERQLNLRIGRMDIPFGEEYLTRDAIDNPLISHSLSDIWGVDEGVELYGSIANVQYVVAVQNGGHPALRDYNIDKSIAARIGYTPTKWLHLSASAMRTGALAVRGDKFSELWFANDFIRSHGSPDTTRFEANLLEGDVRVSLPKGHLSAAGGYLKYDDDDSLANNQQEIYYYYVEAVHELAAKFYVAARWSQILAPEGFSIIGDGDPDVYSLNILTENMWRLGVGLGYRWSPNLLFKAEYTWNQGEELGGEDRTHENVIAGEVAFRF
jgi:hypothetical protein